MHALMYGNGHTFYNQGLTPYCTGMAWKLLSFPKCYNFEIILKMVGHSCPPGEWFPTTEIGVDKIPQVAKLVCFPFRCRPPTRMALTFLSVQKTLKNSLNTHIRLDVLLVKTVLSERGASVKNWKNTLSLFVLKCFQPV